MNNFTKAFYTTKSKSIQWVFAVLTLFLLSTQASFGQTTVFSDDFSANTSATYVTSGAINTTAWSVTRLGADFGARRNTSPAQLELTNDVGATGNFAGWAFASIPVSNFSSPYTSTLSSNPGDVTWNFNMRQIRATASGFASGNYGAAMILGSTGTTATTGNGYAVTIGASGFIRLVRFNNGLAGTQTNIIAGSTNAATNYYSFRVIYTPSTNTWQLLARNDGATAFADPATGTLTAVNTATVDNTYTGSALANFGAFWNGSTTANQTAFFDNVSVTVVSAGPSNDANLSAFTTTATGFTPTFAAGTTAYSATTTFAATTTTVTATRNQAAATLEVQVNGGGYTSLANATASGNLALNVGANTIEVRVTAEDATTQKVYTLTVTRAAASTVSSLSALTTTATGLAPAFASGTTSYTASVLNAVTSVTVTPTRTNAGATLQARVNGGSYASVTSGSPSGALPLNVGPNTIEVLVTAEDGVTTTTYTITVTRSATVLSTDATLSALTTTAGAISPTFASGTTSYTASVANGTTSVTVTPTKTDAGATIQVRVNGGSYSAVTSGSPSGALALNVGSNTINVLVTAEDTVTTITYTITVTRAASTVATLATLSVSAGSISPAFNPATTAYTLTVPWGTTGTTVTATPTDVNVTSMERRTNANSYGSLVSGVASTTLGLPNISPTDNTLDVRVTAQDGTTQIIYTITITRLANTDANLFDLTTSAGVVSPAFASGTTSYTRAVPYSTVFTVTPTIVSGSGATLQIRLNGGSYSATSSGSASSTLALNVGSNTVDVLVTAQDGTTTKTYTITATKAAPSSVATLSTLTTTAGTLTPGFASGTTSYTASVPGTTTSVTVTPTRTEPNATIQVRVNGGSYASVTSGSASGALALNVGNNPIDVLVTAQDGTTTNTYTITVNRAAPPIWENIITDASASIGNPYTNGQSKDTNLTVSGIGHTGFTKATANDRYAISTLTISPSIDLTKYIEFTLTPAVTYKIDFTNFKFNLQLSAGAGAGVTYAIRTNVDSYAANLVSAAVANSASAIPYTVDLSGGSFQNVQVPITFRIYVINSTSGTATFSVNDFEFNGSVSVATPSPEINVKQATSIATGGTYAFGNQENGTNSGPITFTIENLGNAVLNLTGSPSKIVKSGTDAAEFTINETSTTATVAATSGTTTFTVTFTPGSAGAKTAQLSIANDDSTGGENPYIINLTGTSTTSQLSTIAAATFTAPTNIPYASYQANDITNVNSLEVGRFTIQDSASDNDNFGTILNTVTLSLTNPANIKRVAIYDGGTELQEIAAGATNTFNAPALATNLFTTDGGSKTFSIRVTFNASVTDNQQYQFTVTGATAGAAGSGFTSVGGSTSIIGNDNRIVVTANRLSFGTVVGSSFGVPLPSFTISTTDGLGNVDLDRSAAVTLGSTSAFPSANFTRTQPTYALTGGSITISNVAFADGQTDINLTADAPGLTQGVSDPFDILLVTWPANSYRTVTGGTYPSTGGITWEQFVANAWGSSGAPGNNESNTVYIRHNVSIGAFTPQRIVVEAGTLTYTASTTNAVSMLVQSGATLQINAALTVNGTFTVESGGTVNINNATTSGVSSLWNGTEDFQDGSTVNIQNWNYGAGSGDNRLIQNPSIISPNTDGYYFGNLTISGAPSALFSVVEGAQTNVKICQNNFTASNTAQVVSLVNANGASAIIGGNLIASSTGTSFAFSSVTTPSGASATVTVNGNLSATAGVINLSTQSGNFTSNVFLKGNLSIPSLTSLNCTSDVGNILFTGTTGPQTISIAGTLGARVDFEVGDVSTTPASVVQLINQNLSLANATNNLTVRDKSTLDFNLRDVTGAGIFDLNAGGTLKITSASGINATGNNTGNLQNTGSRTISQSGIFHYVGNVTPQATGTAIGTGSSGKRIIIEKTNATDVVNLSQSTGTTDRLEIIEGTFVETAAANVSGSGELRMSGGTYRTAVAGVSPNFVPQLSGAFTLTGGTIDLNAAGNQTLKGARDYRNLTFSTSGIKTLSSAPDSVTGTATVQSGVILNVSNDTFGGPGTNLTLLGTSRYITDGGGVKPDAEGTYDLAATSTVEFANSSGAGIIRLGLSPISYGKIEVTGTNVSSTSATTGILFKSGGSFTVKQGASFTFRQPGGLNGLVNSAVSSTNSPTVTIENTPALSTIVYNGVGQTLTGRADYGNLIINNTSGALTTSGDVTVSGTLTLTKGIVSTGANTIAVTNDTTPISGGSNTAYISGKLRLTYPATGTNVARTFPIGKGAAYRPVTFTYDSNPGSRTVLLEQFETGFPGALPSTASQFGTRYWNITQSSVGASYKVTLDAGPATTSGTVVMIRREGTGASTSNEVTTPNYTNLTSYTTTDVSNDVSFGECTVCSFIMPAQCGSTLPDINTTIYCYGIAGATDYRFKVTKAGTDYIFDNDLKNIRAFVLSQIPGVASYSTTYGVSVSAFIGGSWQAFGRVCNITTPANVTVNTTQIMLNQCGTTLSTLNSTIYATAVVGATQYRFEVTGGSFGLRTFDTPNRYFTLSQLSPGGGQASTTYSIRVAINNGIWQAYGPACNVSTPAPITRMAAQDINTDVFEVKAFPNPFARHFSLDIQSSSDDLVQVRVYDMIGRELEVQKATVSELSTKEIGTNYPSGVYNVVVSQGDKVRSVRMIKR